jgi:hypothetical protein
MRRKMPRAIARRIGARSNRRRRGFRSALVDGLLVKLLIIGSRDRAATGKSRAEYGYFHSRDCSTDLRRMRRPRSSHSREPASYAVSVARCPYYIPAAAPHSDDSTHPRTALPPRFRARSPIRRHAIGATLSACMSVKRPPRQMAGWAAKMDRACPIQTAIALIHQLRDAYRHRRNVHGLLPRR